MIEINSNHVLSSFLRKRLRKVLVPSVADPGPFDTDPYPSRFKEVMCLKQYRYLFTSLLDFPCH